MEYILSLIVGCFVGSLLGLLVLMLVLGRKKSFDLSDYELRVNKVNYIDNYEILDIKKNIKYVSDNKVYWYKQVLGETKVTALDTSDSLRMLDICNSLLLIGKK